MVEQFVEAFKCRWAQCVVATGPYVRQVIRFLAIPLCFLTMIDWSECRRSPLLVVFDLYYIFFHLGYFPDNYGKCRLWEVPRAEWKYYFGSPYNPFQKAHLNRSVQPSRYYVIFEDKEVSGQLCEALGFPVPNILSVVRPGTSLETSLAELNPTAGTEVIAKPSAGAAGTGIILLRYDGAIWRALDKSGEHQPIPSTLPSTYILQKIVTQHSEMARIYDRSLNTIRMLMILDRRDEPRLVSSFARFGTGGNLVDNWSAGGVAVGIDGETGRARRVAFDRRGRCYEAHPTSGVSFADVVVPFWEAARKLALEVQRHFPYYRLLGLDVAIGPEGPVLIELNAFPGLIGQEQTCGPLLKDPRNLRDFQHFDLLTRSMRRALRDDLARLDRTT